ncbi:hypothetical protein EVAR_31009_1 [Eumeta japonica]|uniref:Uncharacterized protein n=1 Tax=Eumeta variegata TaxID=151549 RepID=A0A4C1VDT0_EUMVA|nr:hypothetical protein EVAR_31009_1 [Eumeta japonica]
MVIVTPRRTEKERRDTSLRRLPSFEHHSTKRPISHTPRQRLHLPIFRKNNIFTLDLNRTYQQVKVHKQDNNIFDYSNSCACVQNEKMQAKHSNGTHTEYSMDWTSFSHSCTPTNSIRKI